MIAALILALTVQSPPPVLWNGVRAGMTVEETAATIAPKRRNKWADVAISDACTVEPFINFEDDRVVSVTLAPALGWRCQNIEEMLRARFGDPTRDEQEGELSKSAQRHVEWKTPDGVSVKLRLFDPSRPFPSAPTTWEWRVTYSRVADHSAVIL